MKSSPFAISKINKRNLNTNNPTPPHAQKNQCKSTTRELSSVFYTEYQG